MDNTKYSKLIIIEWAYIIMGHIILKNWYGRIAKTSSFWVWPYFCFYIIGLNIWTKKFTI